MTILQKWLIALNKRHTIKNILSDIKKNRQIIHFITNYVTANDCANICLALGASPVMADEKTEVCDIAQISDVIVINIGTINQTTFEAMKLVCCFANQKHIPIILDPCGVGCSNFRNDCIKTLLTNYQISVIRGNLNEISFIEKMLNKNSDQLNDKNKSAIDSNITMSVEKKNHIAKILAQRLSCVVCISGKIDIITDGQNIKYCTFGSRLLQSITGTGCMLTAVIACFCAYKTDYLNSTLLACEFFGKNAKKFLYSKIKSLKKFNKL